MPKPPETFDEWIAAVIKTRMLTRGMRQEDVAERSGIALTLVGRSLRGTRPLSIREYETIAGVLDADAGEMLTEALDGYGGMSKLLGEVSDAPVSLDAHRRKTPADMTDDELESVQRAATHDPEHESDEPL